MSAVDELLDARRWWLTEARLPLAARATPSELEECRRELAALRTEMASLKRERYEAHASHLKEDNDDRGEHGAVVWFEECPCSTCIEYRAALSPAAAKEPEHAD